MTDVSLSDDHDPFNRTPLKPSDLVSQPELKVKIREFCKQHNIDIEEDGSG
jgi:hypothetical protein